MRNIPCQGVKEIFLVMPIAQFGDLAAGEIPHRYDRPFISAPGSLHALENGGAFILTSDKRIAEIVGIGAQCEG